MGSLTYTRPTPGTVNRRNFAAGLANGSFVRSGSRLSSAAVHPIDRTILSVTNAAPAAQERATSSDSKPLSTWLTRCLPTLRSAQPSPSVDIGAAATESYQPIADVGSSIYLAKDVSARTLGGSEYPMPGSRPSVGTGDAFCPHVVDIPENVSASSTVVTLRFEVQDNGSGLSEEQRHQLFKPYAQVRGKLQRASQEEVPLKLAPRYPLRLQ